MHDKTRSNERNRTAALAAVIAVLGAMLGRAPSVQAQQPFDLDAFFRRAFLTHELQAKSFGPVRWLKQGESYTTIEPSAGASGAADIVQYDVASGQRKVLIKASDLMPVGSGTPLAIENYDWSNDLGHALICTNSRRVWRANTRGDYWWFDLRSKELRKLGGDAAAATLMFAKFSPDGSQVAYVRQNDLYVESGHTGEIRQLTHDGSDTTINGTSDWVYEEELSIRDAFRWSPDGRTIAYWQFDTSRVHKFPLLYNVGAPYSVVTHIPYPDFGVYPVVKEIPYPLPGTPNSAVRVGVVPVTGGETRWMAVPGDPSDTYIARMDWAGDSKDLLLQHLNRLQNTNDLLLANSTTGEVEQIYHDEDPAWVDVVDHVDWIHGGKDFLWTSERDGWRHVYLVSRDGKTVRLVTPGNFDVIDVLAVSRDEDSLFYTASPENATQRYLYKVRLRGDAKAERLTPPQAPGTHRYQLSPDCRWAIHTYSTLDSPPTIDLVRLPDHSAVRVLQDNSGLRAQMKTLSSMNAEFLRVDIGQGVVLDAWMIKPNGFDPAKKYPVLVYVYGEPAGQTVLDSWEGERELFHRALAQRGYVVVSVDNRGTPAPRGRAWRKIIYGSVGVLSTQEQTQALKMLQRTHAFMDPERTAVWGWSGGGSNTLNLMFRSPDTYRVGMSVAPVADQRLYDSIYQERYMGLPQANADGYRAGSAINFAEGLRGNLLIVHSPGDDNVHYQGTELLINRLVELGKPFDFMEYPGQTHGLSDEPGTHYHLYSMLARYLQDHLKAGGLPQ